MLTSLTIYQFFAQSKHHSKKQNDLFHFRDYSKFSTEAYLQDISAVDWDVIFEHSNNLHEATARSIGTLKSIVNKHAPPKQVSRSKQKQFQKPWISMEILKSVKTKHAMYKTHYLSNNPVKIREFKNYSNRLNHLKNISKKAYFCKKFDLSKNNLKATWKITGNLIKRKTKGQITPLRIVRNNRTYTCYDDIADQFNKHFVNVGPSLASKIEDCHDNPTQYILSSPANSFVMSTVTENQVLNLFMSLDKSKSSIDIPNNLIKLAAEPLSAPFTKIYNQSIQTGVVPNILKVSQVTPVYKSGDVTNPGNYRPISILSPFSKVLGKLVYNQLYDFLDKQNILYRYQFGFRKGHSTEQAILEITGTIKQAMDKKMVTCGVFLNSKAFDTVNHEILLSKLYHYGIRGIPLDWFENYLHNRTQFVKIGSSQSNTETITCGIPQGSTLGPLLFLLYFNDLPNCSKKLSFRIFADDTNMFFTSDNLLHLESVMKEDLNSVFKYCNINKLSINYSKATYMVISSARLRSYIHIPNIAHKTQIKYLGIYIDQNLLWGPQIQYINNKLAKNIAIIHKLRYFVDLHTLKQLYYSFIYPYLSYAIITWGSACKTSLRRILTKQNKCVRSMFFAYGRDNATPYFNLLGILKFENVYKFKVALFTHKILNGSTNISVIFHRTLTRASEIHTHNTRFAAKLNFHRPKPINNYGTSTFAFVSSKLWETIPTNIKRLPYTSFLNQYKLYLLNTQSSV